MATRPFRIVKNKQGDLFAIKNLNSNVTNSPLNTSLEVDSRFDTGSLKAMHCLYKFIAKEDEKVALSFLSFKLRGDEPECTREYVDIYVDLKPEDNISAAIGQRQPNGRFCTSIVPRKVVSLHNLIVLSIYTELDLPSDNKPLFSGQYEFYRPKTWDQIGPPEPGTLCVHTIYGSKKREGEFQSVTYPGSYVKDLHCSYKFIGESGQRIRLEFLDLDLYSGGPHCPLDSVKVFDGLDDTSDPIIQTICGSHRSLVIFSTREQILVTFVTTMRETEVHNRGFSAYFEFSDKFFDLSFILGGNARHIRGSECDQRIVSTKGTTGLIASPDFKNHTNTVCRYIFEGLQNSLDYEKVLIKFIEFDLKSQRTSSQESLQSSSTASSASTIVPSPNISTVSSLMLMETLSRGNDDSAPTLVLSSPSSQNSPNSTTGSSIGAQSSNASNSSDQICPDNYVRLYTGEQKPDQKQDPNDYDYVFCSNELPSPVESDAASLFMEYNTGSIGGHFKAEYKFTVDFRIPGQQVASGCNYIYKSEYLKAGTFNSPRHPSWYINDMDCTYTFMTKNDEALLLQFTSFKMANSFGEKDVGINEACKGEDLVGVYELVLDPNERVILDQREIGTYCGTTAPGPILSYRPVRVNLRTNKEVANYGFSAMYNFHQINELKTNEFVANCGEQINTRQAMQRHGVFSSPPTYRSVTYEKRNHICSWNITARPSHRIQLDFDIFAIEGNPAARGCAAAAVRLESSLHKRPIELCGTLSPNNGSSRRFVSDNEWFAVTFISTKRASGSDGFKATWTEIKKLQT